MPSPTSRSFLVLAVFSACFLAASCKKDDAILPGLTRDAGTRSDMGERDAEPSDADIDAEVVLDGNIDDANIGDADVDAGNDAGVDAGMSCEDPPLGPSRPLPTMCSLCRPARGGSLTGECTNDSDCTEGMNGRCINSSETSFCDYDHCFGDEDCDEGFICECDGSRGGGNICVPSNCITDDDCGEFTCSPTLGSCGHFTPPVAYRCHTNEDACSTDADCSSLGENAYCFYDESVMSWQCSTSECIE